MHSINNMPRKNSHAHHHEPLNFPKGFLWGTATSAHQVEGNNKASDWWEWEQKKGNIENNEISGKAADHYKRYEEDFDILKSLNNNTHRLGIEWARIEPEEGKWDEEAILHYHKVFKALKNRKIKIMLTVNHFTLPEWAAKNGGWEKSKTVRRYNRYVNKIAKEYSEYIDFWITLNEPIVYMSMSYIAGTWPPKGFRKFFKSTKVFFKLLKAHKKAYRTIRKHSNKPIGIAKNMISFVSYGGYSFINFFYLKTLDFMWNRIFYILSKRYHDFFGVNYYFHQRLKRENVFSFPLVDIHEEDREHSDLGWEIYPEGIFHVLMNLKKYKKPIYITENGIAAENDSKRTRYIISHLIEIYHAIQSGVDVRGYYYWSLLDNFEWHEGFAPRFGLVGVNYKTMKRTPNQSAEIYAKIAKENKVGHELLFYLGHGLRDACTGICGYITTQKGKVKRNKNS